MKNIERLTLDSFNPICIVGKGSYAHVVLVSPNLNDKESPTKHYYALKIMDKADIEIRNIRSSVFLEKKILQILNKCPFTTSLYATFQDDEEICFLLEYCPGGDLFELLKRKKYFDENDTRFYMSQLILGLEAIHKNKIIYRDLKPENIMIDSKGNIKIADFGRASFVSREKDKIKGLSGTPEYMAPEMIAGNEYSKSVDIWSLGCILYEMIVGSAPFSHKNQKKLFELIQKKGFFMPGNINVELQDLLNKLLEKNPKKRIKLSEIKKHSWFQHFDWKAAEDFKLETPWKPEVNIDNGVCNFNNKFVSMSFDLITCGLEKELDFPDFYFESPEIQIMDIHQKHQYNNSKDDYDEEEREDERWGEMNSFNSDDNSYNDKEQWSTDEDDSDNEWDNIM